MNNIRVKLLSLLLLALLAFTFPKQNVAQTAVKKYEYAVLYLNEHSKNKIEIFYGSNKVENYTEMKKATMESGSFNNNNNLVDALNYMDSQGFELITSTIEPPYGSGVGYHFVFRRNILDWKNMNK